MIASEDYRRLASFQRLQHQLGLLGASGGDFSEVLGARIAFFLLLGNSNGDVPGIFDDEAQRLETSLQASHAHRRWAHVHAPARLAEIERDADHANFLARKVGSCCRHSLIQ